jgi:uncharacterized protein YjiS (DUF1127 family)
MRKLMMFVSIGVAHPGLAATSWPRRQRALPALRLSDLAAILRLWHSRNRQRRGLGELAGDDHLLKDIGVARYDALREAAKPFWQQ